jgi:hypothetical protein
MRRATRVKSWRSICASACALFALASATSASAASTYVGRAVDDPKTRIEFRKAGGEVRGFEVRRVRMECFDGAIFRGDTRFGPMAIDRDGHFEGDYMSQDEQQSGQVHGSLTAGRATGTLRITATFGTVYCVSGRLEWRARRI